MERYSSGAPCLILSMRTALYLIATFAIMLAVFTGLSLFSTFIPREAMTDNIRSSAITLHNEGCYPRKLSGYFQQDNYSDAIILNTAYGIERHDALTDALASRSYWFPDSAPTDYFYNINVRNAKGETGQYARYWHGYTVLLRPLLTFADYSGLRVINYIVLLALSVIILVLTLRRLPLIYFSALLITLIAADIYLLPLTLHFSSVMYVTFLCIIFIYTIPTVTRSHRAAMCLFLATGAATSFVDLLSAPLLSWGLPVVIYLGLVKSHRKTSAVIRLLSCWCAGYAAMWISKWVLVSVFVSPYIFRDAFQAAVIRTVDDPLVSSQLHLTWQLHKVRYTIVAAAAAIFLATALYAMYRSRSLRQTVRQYAYLAVTAAVPAIWYMAMFTHSIRHLFFARRTACVALFALIIFFYRLCNCKRQPQS